MPSHAALHQIERGIVVDFQPVAIDTTHGWEGLRDPLHRARGRAGRSRALDFDSCRSLRAAAVEGDTHVAKESMVQFGQIEDHAAESARVDEALQLAVFDRTQEEATLRMIIEGVEAETGKRFFPSLVRHLADALGVQYAFVSKMSEDRTHFRTLAVWGRGALLSNFEIPLRGTPCEAVLNGHTSHHPRHLQLLFPSDVGLVDWRGESYCGVPLVDSSGRVVGHLAIVDDKPMPDGTRNLSILRIFAARTWAEIERNRAHSGLRKREEAYRDLYEEAPVAYVSVGTDGRIRKATGALLNYSDTALAD